MWRSLGFVLVLSAAAAPAFAQVPPSGPVPARGMSAVGISIGLAVPGDDGYDNGWTLTVTGEHYVTRRVGVRGSLAAAGGVREGAGEDNSMSPVLATGNLLYNWERGAWHPYATAGIGLYKFRFTEDGVDSHDTTVGFNIGGGAEYFLTRSDAITGEWLMHPLVGVVDSRNASYFPWFWTLSAGYKKFF
jgi:hypothetical protein